MNDVVVFDLGGVLCDFRPERRLTALANESGIGPNDIERLIWSSGLDERSERGELSREETVESLLDALGRRLGPAALHRAWARAFVPNDAVLQIVRRTTVRRFVFTNNGPLLKSCLSPRITLLVEQVVCSCDLQARKPGVVAFERLAFSLGLEPSAIVLVDDDEDNCKGAALTGIRPVRFDGVDALGESLSELGLFPSSVPL